MAKQELIQSITQLSKKVDILLDRISSLEDEKERLEEENNRLRKQHLEDLSELEKANKDIEFLSLSHRLASSPEALVEARNTVSRLIRTIDSCIRLINED